MLEQELQLEKDLFFALNGSDSILLDHFFWLYSLKWIWLPLYVCFLFIFVFKKPWKEVLLVLVSIFLAILIGDQIASGFFKPVFERFRPTHHPDFKNIVDTVFNYRGGRFGFISSHAANSFGFVMFTALLFKNRLYTIVFMFHALVTSYSRIYLGVHFISDVVVGALVGILSGYAVYKLYVYARKKTMKLDPQQLEKPLYSSQETYFLCGIYFLFILSLLFFNNVLVKLFLE